MAITKNSENLYSSMRFVGDGVTKRVPLTFDLNRGDGLAVDFGEGLVTSGYLIDYDVTPVVVLFSDPLPLGKTITIRRLTKIDKVKHIFQWTGNAQGGADFSAKNVDENFEQITRASQDAMDSQTLASTTLEEMAGIRDTAIDARDKAKVSEINAKASETASRVAQESAGTSAVEAWLAEGLAKKWANNPEDVPVVNGEYSAYHWSKKAESSAGGLTPSVIAELDKKADKDDVEASLESITSSLNSKLDKDKVLNEWGDHVDATLSQKFLSDGRDFIDAEIADLNSDIVEIKSNIIKNEREPESYSTVEYVQGELFNYSIVRNILSKDVGMFSNFKEQGSNVLVKKTCREIQKEINAPVIINGTAFRNTAGQEAVMNSILIEDGVEYYTWGTDIGTRTQAMCIMQDGSLKRFYHPTTPAEMISQGAVHGVSWGAFIMYENEIPDDFYTSVFNTGQKSGRTIIAVDSFDNYCFIAIEGKTDSYGATGEECVDLVVGLGLKSAFMLDGGGSTQMYTNGTYATPSSEGNQLTRTVPNFFYSKTPLSNVFDTGIIELALDDLTSTPVTASYPMLYIRQVGETVSLTFNSRPFNVGAINANDMIPLRFMPESTKFRGMFNAGSGFFAITGGGGALLGTINTLRIGELPLASYLAGCATWDINFK